MKIEVTVF